MAQNLFLLFGLLLLTSCSSSDLVFFESRCNGFNASYAPMERFCEDNNMTYSSDNRFWQSGCFDNNGELHSYKVTFENGSWVIGTNKYEAEFTRC